MRRRAGGMCRARREGGGMARPLSLAHRRRAQTLPQTQGAGRGLGSPRPLSSRARPLTVWWMPPLLSLHSPVSGARAHSYIHVGVHARACLTCMWPVRATAPNGARTLRRRRRCLLASLSFSSAPWPPSSAVAAGAPSGGPRRVQRAAPQHVPRARWRRRPAKVAAAGWAGAAGWAAAGARVTAASTSRLAAVGRGADMHLGAANASTCRRWPPATAAVSPSDSA